jgi:hypothetical protein
MPHVCVADAAGPRAQRAIWQCAKIRRRHLIK